MREALAQGADRSATLIHFLDEMTAAEARALRRALNGKPRRRG